MAEELQEEVKPDGTPLDTETHREAEAAVSPKHQLNGTSGGGADVDAQEMVIGSLRLQVQDLFSQVNQLNNKLVKSYDRVSDLEDNLHVASSNIRSSSLKISQLELERTQHLSALNTGLLVEKSHVTAELNRLMEKATEEAAQRGQAESARNAIEKDLDDLSATLFGQANTMVAEARFAQHLSERKVEDAQNALKGAEEVVSLMQNQMQVLQAEKELADNKSREMELLMGKGKWVQRGEVDQTRSLKLLNSHSPYQEFLLFVAHLRLLRPNSPYPPAMSTLLPLPFLARLLNEDSEPTVRLDLAPSLNWLSRRSVLAAIHTGQLTIEPIPVGTLLQEASSFPTPTTIAGLNSSNDNASCALCGTSVFSTDATSLRPSRPNPHPMSISNFHSNSATWSAGAFFKRTPSTFNTTQPPSPTNSASRASTTEVTSHHVYIFRLASTPASTISAFPLPNLSKSLSSTGASTPPQHPSGYNSSPSSTASNSQSTTIYPLCSSGWCLLRLRATCSLWSFVRTGIVEKVWEEEVPTAFSPPPSVPQPAGEEKPPIPPRKRGLWGIASALGEKAASWSDSDKGKGKPSATATLPNTPPSEPAVSEVKKRQLPPPPPSHPSSATGHGPQPSVHGVPPPLPKRNAGRSRVPLKPSPSGSDAEAPPATATTPQTDLATTTEPPTNSQTPSAAPLVPPERSSTPHSAPLPESRPSTPANLPPRIASPAAVGATPPLPRRAAARRPVPPIAGSSLSRPTTPAVSNTTPPPTEIPPPVEGEPVVADIPTSTEAVISPAAPGAASEGEVSEEPKRSELEKPTPVADAEEVVNLATVVVDEKTTTPSLEEAVNENATTEGRLLDRSMQGSPVSEDVFLDAPSEKVASGQSSPTLKLNDENAVVESKPVGSNDLFESRGVSEDHSKDQDETAVSKEEEKDKGTYVGDATWEERTWKELVRLKEDMFWARVGGLR